MIQIKTISNLNSADMLKKAMHVAACYGFDPIEKIVLEQKKRPAMSSHTGQAGHDNDTGKKKSLIQKISKQDIKDLRKDLLSDEIVSTLQQAAEYDLLPSQQPILICRNSIGAESNKIKKEALRFSLMAIGMNKSIAEALILKTAYAILDDIGIGEIQVYINSIGDKDSMQKFARELNSYLRKNADSLPAHVRHYIMKKDIFNAYEELYMRHHPLEGEIPQSIRFLSDKSRKHLSEVLEYLETGDIPYEIDNSLIGNGDLYSQTFFEIRHAGKAHNDKMSILAKGGRSEEISKRIFRHDMPTVAIVFEFEKKGIKKKELDTLKRARKPKVYFIQLGYEAKLKSLYLIDALRRANVPLYHNLNNDKFCEQLAFAKHLGVPCSIIMGHREALDGTVIVRDMNTQFQNTVLVDELPAYLKERNI